MLEYEKLYNEYKKLLQNNIKAEEKTFFHYTSPMGLKGIIENKCLWFSNVEYLNDETELFYTYKIVKDLCAKNDTDFCRAFFNTYDAYLKKGRQRTSSDYFIASFSGSPDNLSMWNYYTKTPNSIGYNIEFNVNNIFNRFKNEMAEKLDTSRIISGKVIYDAKIQENIIKNAIKEFDDLYINSDDIKKASISLFFWYFINDCSLFFKHSSFKIEDEYRIILPKGKLVKNSDVLKIRELNGFFIPYIETKFLEEDVLSIGISPANKSLIIKNGVEQLLSVNKYPKIKIRNSNIPLRY